MANILPVDTEKLAGLKTELLMALELQRDVGCDIESIRLAAESLAHAAAPLIEMDTAEGLDESFPAVENTYRDWKDIAAAFTKTIDMAYNGVVPKGNLLLDDVLDDLQESFGDPVAARYSQMREQIQSHVSDRPWDQFMKPTPEHLDARELETAMSALVRGDDLDVEDAVGAVTGPLRYAFAEAVRANPAKVDDLELGLWKRPEFIIAGDYWGHRARARLIDLLKTTGSERFTQGMYTLEALFSPTRRNARSVLSIITDAPEAYRERLTRCLLLHPDHEIRGYAVTNVSEASIWKVLTPTTVPCATILTVLEHMVGSAHFSASQRKLFFDTIYRRMLSLASRSDVLYARGIVRILMRQNFLLEDEYFSRFMTLLDYLKAKEEAHGIDDPTIGHYIDLLHSEKARVGSLASLEPDFREVPLVILRKLARDGHFWDLLSMHSIAKIARETIPFVNTRDRALKVANNHRVNPEVLRVVGRNRSLFTLLNARIALLSNPRTPPLTSIEYISDLTRKDIEQLLRKPGIHPELRTRLRARFIAWKR